MASMDKAQKTGHELDQGEVAETIEKTTSTGRPDVQAATSSRPAEHTGKTAGNQAKATGSHGRGDPQEDLVQRIEKKQRMVAEVLVEKELLLLAYIDQQVPYPYYESWCLEANRNFRLLGRLSHRRQSWAKKGSKAS